MDAAEHVILVPVGRMKRGALKWTGLAVPVDNGTGTLFIAGVWFQCVTVCGWLLFYFFAGRKAIQCPTIGVLSKMFQALEQNIQKFNSNKIA